MLGKNDPVATVAVRDLAAAKRFYGETLGLKQIPSKEPEVLNFKSGHTALVVYKSQFAGTNKATSVTWPVDDVEDVAKTLEQKGVAFEHYDMPGMTLKGDVHLAGKMKAAWFKDPDGNIHGLVSERAD